MLATESLIIVDHDQILAVFFYIVLKGTHSFSFYIYILFKHVKYYQCFYF